MLNGGRYSYSQVYGQPWWSWNVCESNVLPIDTEHFIVQGIYEHFHIKDTEHVGVMVSNILCA